MEFARQLPLQQLNSQLICSLCSGYFVDAFTVVECLHSFCKSCILSHVERTPMCPSCDTQLNKARVMAMIRPDQTLQTMVYKLVPGLFEREMARRRSFYQQHSQRDGSLSPELRGEVISPYFVYTLSDSVSLCLSYTNSRKNAAACDQTASQRYFLAPASCTVRHLHKLLRNKYQLDDSFKMKIRLNGEVLDEELTMVDVAYLCSWDRDHPIQLSYDLAVKRSAADVPLPVHTKKYCAFNGKVSQNGVVHTEEQNLSLVDAVNGSVKSDAVRSETGSPSDDGSSLAVKLPDVESKVADGVTSRDSSMVTLNNNVSCEKTEAEDGKSVRVLESDHSLVPIGPAPTDLKTEPSARDLVNGTPFVKDQEKADSHADNEYGCSYFSKVDATINDVIKQNLTSYTKGISTASMKRSMDHCWKSSNGVPSRTVVAEDSGVDTDSSEKSVNRDKSSLDVYDFDVDAEDEPCSKRANFGEVNSKTVSQLAVVPRQTPNIKVVPGAAQQTDRSIPSTSASSRYNCSPASSNIKEFPHDRLTENNADANNLVPSKCFKSNTKTVGLNTVLSCSKENGHTSNFKINCSTNSPMMKPVSLDGKSELHNLNRPSFSGSFRPDSTAHLNSFISNYMVKPPVSYSSKLKPLNPVVPPVPSNPQSVYSSTLTNRNVPTKMRPIAPHPLPKNQEMCNGNEVKSNTANLKRSHAPSNCLPPSVKGNRPVPASVEPPTKLHNNSNCSELMMHLTANTPNAGALSSSDISSRSLAYSRINPPTTTIASTTPVLPPSSQSLSLSQAQLLWHHAAAYPAMLNAQAALSSATAAKQTLNSGCPVKRLPTSPASRQPPALKPINDSRVPMKPDELNSFLQLVSKSAVSEPSGSWRLTTEASVLLNTVSSLTAKTNDSKTNSVSSTNQSKSPFAFDGSSVAASSVNSGGRTNDASNIQDLVSSEITITKLPNKHQQQFADKSSSITSILKQVRKNSAPYHSDATNVDRSAELKMNGGSSSMTSLLSKSNGSITITSPPARGDRVSASVTIEKLGSNCTVTSASSSGGTAGVVVPARTSAGGSPKLDAIAESLAVRKLQGHNQTPSSIPCSVAAALSTRRSFLTPVSVPLGRSSVEAGARVFDHLSTMQSSTVPGAVAVSAPPKNSLLACAPAPSRPATTTRPVSDSSLRHAHLPSLPGTDSATAAQPSPQASSLDRIQKLTNSLS